MRKLFPVHRYSVDIFHILVFQEYWDLTESRMLGGMRLLHFLLVLMNGLNKAGSSVILYCRFSLSLKDPFFQISFNKNVETGVICKEVSRRLDALTKTII